MIASVMLLQSRQEILERVGDADRVLDVGGWADPFWRADWVMDLMPYESRGLYEREGWIEPRDDPADRFRADTWVQRDICSRDPFPFADGEFDFVVCAHTLEDVRDPVWVCAELQRIGKAGYIEVPSRLEELSWGVAGAYVGWSHHRWLIDVRASSIEFVQKLHSLHSEPEHYFPEGFWARLPEQDRVQTMWWDGSFSSTERVLLYDDERDRYLRPLIEQGLAEHPLPGPMLREKVSRRLRRAGS